MLNINELETTLQGLNELIKNETDKTTLKYLKHERSLIKTKLYNHKAYLERSKGRKRFMDGECYKTYGKTCRNLNEEEKRQYWTLKQREYRMKKKYLKSLDF